VQPANGIGRFKFHSVEKETWHVIEELVDEGLVKNIGLSNVYDSALLLEVLRYAKIPPQVLQVDIHPSLIQDPLVEFAKRHGMAVTAYSDFELPVSLRASPKPQHGVLMDGLAELLRTVNGSRCGQFLQA